MTGSLQDSKTSIRFISRGSKKNNNILYGSIEIWLPSNVSMLIENHKCLNELSVRTNSEIIFFVYLFFLNCKIYLYVRYIQIT
jgi:hypothetical protein